jgi:hypothetical protein
LEETFSRKFAPEVIDDVREVGLAYRIRASNNPAWPLPGKDWFHLARGAVALSFQEEESARAEFEGHPLKVKIALETATTDEPVRKGLATRFAEALANAGAKWAGAVSPVKNRKRAAAGLEGEEMVMRDADAKHLHFLWNFPGERSSGAKPEITFTMETADERFDEKLALWNRVVDSLGPAAAR